MWGPEALEGSGAGRGASGLVAAEPRSPQTPGKQGFGLLGREPRGDLQVRKVRLPEEFIDLTVEIRGREK